MIFFIPVLFVVGGAIAASLTNAVQQPLDSQLTHHHHHHWSSNKTIYAALSDHKEFSKLIKAINFAGKIASVLNDTSADVTFFAVPDSALRRPHRHHPEFKDIVSSVQDYDLADAIALVEELQITKDGNDEDKKKKKFLKKLVRAILSYHILPHKFDAQHLARNNTFPTHLVLPETFGGRPLRIRVVHSLISPVPTINFYSKVIEPNNDASNGVVHVVNHPLLPPPPVFQDLFLVPSMFATFTSAVQRTGLTDLFDLRYRRGKQDEKGSLIGSNTVTVFAPTNHAFDLLPRKLRLYLFSSFGARTLKKLLQYHIVPGLVFHTDYVYNKTDDHVHSHYGHQRGTYDLSKVGALGTNDYPLKYWDSSSWTRSVEDPVEGRNAPAHRISHSVDHPKPIEAFDVELLSALADHTLHAHVEKFRFSIPIPNPHNRHIVTTKFTINGHPVVVSDIVGLNGAVHVIEHLLDPRGHDHSHNVQTNWEDWEEWLPQWAAAEN